MQRLCCQAGSAILGWLLLSLAVQATPLWLGHYTGAEGGLPEGWRLVQIDPEVAPTRYGLRLWDGLPAVEAHADSSMTLLARAVKVDLDATPILCWHWRIDAPVAAADIYRRAGDDQAARVYVGFRVLDDSLDWATRMKLSLARAVHGQALPDLALNYVWDNRAPVGTHTANAFTELASMLVLESGPERVGRWVSERRDLRQDFKAAFGPVAAEVVLMAIASDTDNTGSKAHAGFAELHLVGAAEACAGQ